MRGFALALVLAALCMPCATAVAQELSLITVLIALLAAGMVAQAVQFLDAAGMIDVLGTRLWDTSAWLPQDGIVGRLLHTLVGYTDRPTELQLIAYLATLAVMAALTWVAAPPRTARAAV
jgi:high-affinity iron transporter